MCTKLRTLPHVLASDGQDARLARRRTCGLSTSACRPPLKQFVLVVSTSLATSAPRCSMRRPATETRPSQSFRQSHAKRLNQKNNKTKVPNNGTLQQRCLFPINVLRGHEMHSNVKEVVRQLIRETLSKFWFPAFAPEDQILSVCLRFEVYISRMAHLSVTANEGCEPSACGVECWKDRAWVKR